MSSDHQRARTEEEDAMMKEGKQADGGGRQEGEEEAGKEEKPRVFTAEEAAQLDDDEFFKAYKEGKIARREDHWTEENFEEEMEKHPLFMTKEPSNEEYVTNPHLAALQEMFAELTPAERAEHHKTHGNESYKKARAAKKIKKVQQSHLKKAIHYYSEGLREMSKDDALESVLLSNRAMCQLLLRNNRSALKDCQLAVRYKPDNIKAYFRAASACFNMERYGECIGWCDEVLGRDPSNADTVTMRQKAVKLKAAKEKKARKAAAEARREKRLREQINAAIKDRGIRLLSSKQVEWGEYFKEIDSDDDDDDDDAHARPQTLLPTQTNGPQLQDGQLHWPVLLLYPEHAQTDFIQEFAETTAFEDHLKVMFPDEPTPTVPWDTNNTYKWNRLQVYFEEVDASNTRTKRLVPVKQSATLVETLQDARYGVRGLVPFFIVVVEGSEHARRFKEEYTLMPK